MSRILSEVVSLDPKKGFYALFSPLYSMKWVTREKAKVVIIIQKRDDKVRIENSKNDTNEDELQLGPLFGLEV